jgi:hypothetical protein
MHRLLTGSLNVDRVQVAISGLPIRYSGLRLVQLSDFHFDGIRLSKSLLAEAIEASNAANPDLILLTGDFVTDAPEAIHELSRWLKALRSSLGTYAVLGNHDLRYHRSRSVVTEALTQAGITVLWNEVTYPLGTTFCLVGLADYWSAEFRPAPVMRELDPTLPRIVMSHNPDTAAILREWRVDLQLSGHTHGGQLVLPGIGTAPERLAQLYALLPKPYRRHLKPLRSCYTTVKHWQWARGLHPIGTNQLYVNRGLGTYFPGRLFCPPEVTVITLISH